MKAPKKQAALAGMGTVAGELNNAVMRTPETPKIRQIRQNSYKLREISAICV